MLFLDYLSFFTNSFIFKKYQGKKQSKPNNPLRKVNGI